MGLFSSLGDMFAPDYSNSMDSMQQAQQYQMPFYNAGVNMLDPYTSMLQSLTSDPTALEDQIMGKYSMSPTATYQTQQMQDSMNRSAAMSGNLSSPAEQQQMANQTQGLVSRDQQKYLQGAMNPFLAGLQGQQYVTGMGQQAGNQLSNIQQSMANLQAGQTQQGYNMLGSLVGLGTSAI